MKNDNDEHPLGDKGQISLTVFFLIIWLTDSFWLHWTTILVDAVPLLVRLLLAVVILTLSIWLILSAHFIVKDESRFDGIVKHGVFRIIRHPLYLGSMLFILGLAFATFSLASFGVFLIIFCFYDFIARYEEKILESKFGDEYKSYKENTGKWLPRLTKKKERE